MSDAVTKIGGMIVLRPYVFVFFAVYLIAAVTRIGWKKTAIFTVLAYAIAFAAEFSSTRTGFPFGLYHYIDVTRNRELWISNVPFWDSLSFTFLCYLGFSLGVLIYAPLQLRRDDVQVIDTLKIRGSWQVLMTGTLFMALIDVVIDPLTLRGERWFLGRIYFYEHPGVYFGVPMSNFLGWAFVGAVTIFLFQRIEAWLGPPMERPRGVRYVRYAGLLEPALYGGVLLFNVGLTFWIGEPLLGAIAGFIYLPVTVLVAATFLDPRRQAQPADIAAHRYDFPYTPVSLQPDVRQIVAAG